jgi:TrmH family RNA methyltransferase
VVAVARTPVAVAASVLDGATFVVVATDLADPGNAGTIVRTAHAAGADAVVLAAGSVDAWSPKVVRSAAGALFHVPVVVDLDAAGALARLGAAGLTRLGAVARGGVACDRADLAAPVALVLGGEAHGLAPDVLAGLDGLVSIPMPGPAESLNVAVAAGVLCFEVVRQRRAGRSRDADVGGAGAPG